MNERRRHELIAATVQGAEQAAQRYQKLDPRAARQVGIYCLHLITHGKTLRAAWRRARQFARVLAGDARWPNGLNGRAAG